MCEGFVIGVIGIFEDEEDDAIFDEGSVVFDGLIDGNDMGFEGLKDSNGTRADFLGDGLLRAAMRFVWLVAEIRPRGTTRWEIRASKY